MSELRSIRAKMERQGEAKYNYLANFTANEFNPKEDNNFDSYSNHSKLIERRSPGANSNERKSHLRPTFRQYSPSCSTFNHKQSQQQQFSPYNERQHREQIKISKELIEQNAFLKSKLAQSEQVTQTLTIELNKKDAQIVKIKEKNKSDLIYFEKAVSDLTNEIQLALTKNTILENELVVAKVKLQEQIKKQQERREDDLKRVEEGRRQAQNRKNSTAGRSLDKSVHKIQQSQKENIKDYKNKNIDESAHHNQFNLAAINLNETTKINIELEKEIRRSQEFISSIKSMQFKITGQQPSSPSLKQLWKWLKGIGHTHSCLKKWKSKVSAVNSYLTNSDKLKEVIRQACSYIQ